jgi:hydrogenase/urease accessory protein HupE
MQRLWWGVLLVVVWPSHAFAHSSTPGLSGIYWGMLHPFSSAATLLLLIVLGLFVQQRLPASELTLLAFVAATFVGGSLLFLEDRYRRRY